MEWRSDMENAPRDGTVVLVGSRGFFGGIAFPVRARYADGRWVFAEDDYLDGRPFEPQPTHWKMDDTP